MQYIKLAAPSAIYAVAGLVPRCLPEVDADEVSLEAAFFAAADYEKELEEHHQRYTALKSKLADQQYWASRKAKLLAVTYEAEVEAAQLSFASNRVALQCIGNLLSVNRNLLDAAAKLRAKVPLIPDWEEHKKRRIMNNLILAGQLYWRLTRYISIEWTPNEEQVGRDERARERATDVNFLEGLKVLRESFEGTSGSCQFVPWTEVSWAFVDSESAAYDSTYECLQNTVAWVRKFVIEATQIFAEMEKCAVKQKESSYQKRLRAAGNDGRRGETIRVEQARLRAELSNLKSLLRELPVDAVRESMQKALMPYFQADSGQYSLAVVNNVVFARRLHLSVYELMDNIKKQCSYQDDVSSVGLNDIYAQESVRLRNSEFTAANAGD